MSWKLLGDSGDRWEWTADDTLHLLLHCDDELRELHVLDDGQVYVHVYALNPERHPDALATTGAPLQYAKHLRTWQDDRFVRTDTDEASRPAWFTWLEEEGYVQE